MAAPGTEIINYHRYDSSELIVLFEAIEVVE